MEEFEFDEILDDWFIDSLKAYKDLHVYQLEFPTRVIEWTSAKTVCVASCDAFNKNHILELGLPPKLFAQQQGVCAERDFRVLHGGFCPGPVSVLKHFPGTRLIVTNDGRTSDLLVWNLGGDDSDVIAEEASVAGSKESQGGVKVAARTAAQAEVVHGRRVADVKLTHLDTGQSVYTLASLNEELVSSFHFASDAVFLIACGNGDVHTVDTRVSTPPRCDPAPPFPSCRGVWRTDVRESQLVRVSTCGRTAISDPRSPAVVVRRARLAPGKVPGDPEDVTVSWAPGLDDVVAVSGFNGNVQIYDTSSWTSDPRDVDPLFEHGGHTVCSPQGGAVVARHLWHPQKSRTLVSAASDASLHVWDWIQR
nr:WD repeat-containing protein 73-like [Nerophis lumbriciformis]